MLLIPLIPSWNEGVINDHQRKAHAHISTESHQSSTESHKGRPLPHKLQRSTSPERLRAGRDEDDYEKTTERNRSVSTQDGDVITNSEW